jgi:hypothetical protein
MTRCRRLSHFAIKNLGAGVLIAITAGVGAGAAPSDQPGKKAPLVIEDQGSKAFGGTVIGDPANESLYCDHGYVEWQIPKSKQRKVPIVMWHSASTRTWESPTPSGGEGFNNIFLRRRFPIYIIDLPPSGRAAQSCEPFSYTPHLSRPPQAYAAPFPNIQEPLNDPAVVNQIRRADYFELQTKENVQLQSDEVGALLKEMGPAVLFTHSGSGVRGWWTAIKSDKVQGIVGFEPGYYLFPQNEVPPPIPRDDGTTTDPFGNLGSAIPLSDFMKLTKIPILIVLGDHPPLENERIRKIRAKAFVETINRHGGKAELYSLPDHGIHGNTHFIMWDQNNEQVADIVEEFLSRTGIDKLAPQRQSGAAATK